MNIYELSDILGAELKLIRYPNQDSRWTAEFSDCEIKNKSSDGCLIGEYGNGKTPYEAIKNYAEKISGKVLVFNAYSPTRKEFNCPKLTE